jgi:hypothetical protein
LLGVAFAHFFSREVKTNGELARGLMLFEQAMGDKIGSGRPGCFVSG